MSYEQLDLLDRKLDTIVARTESYPIHLQPTILKILWHELNGSSGIASKSASTMVRMQPVNGSNAMSVEGDGVDWDYRRGLDQLAEQHDFDLKSPFDYEYVLIVTYVLQYLSPAGFEGCTITNDHVKKAWKHAGRDLPLRLREPLSEAARRDLLEKARDEAGYILTPRGENHVKKLLASGNSS